MVTVLMAVQPLASVTVIVYVVVEAGLATGLGMSVALNPAEGAQLQV